VHLCAYLWAFSPSLPLCLTQFDNLSITVFYQIHLTLKEQASACSAVRLAGSPPGFISVLAQGLPTPALCLPTALLAAPPASPFPYPCLSGMLGIWSHGKWADDPTCAQKHDQRLQVAVEVLRKAWLERTVGEPVWTVSWRCTLMCQLPLHVTQNKNQQPEPTRS
jgi:hypothetical protein